MKFVRISILLIVINSGYIKTYTQKCEKPELQNGKGILAQGGRYVRYMCLPDFTLNGEKFSSCVGGEWANPVPKCLKPGCPDVVLPNHGFAVADANGAMLMLFCRAGYSIAGNHETFCNGATWDRSLGTCREDQASLAMSCDFEVSTICGWEADPSHDLDWKRKNGYATVTRTQTGPQHDNTFGIPLEGHFMLATFSSQSPNSVARLISPLYSAAASKDACFRFYYHMYGAITGVLRIYVKPESLALADILGSPDYLFMEKSGSHENAWLESVFKIDELKEDFQIVIEATTVSSIRSNIAIDDVALMSGAGCINEKSKSTTVTPDEGGIYDTQTCVNRCQETISYSRYVTKSILTRSNKTVNILQCDCFDGCVDLMSCCLDYESVCVFDSPTVASTDPETVTKKATSSNVVRTTSAPSTFSTMLKTTTLSTVAIVRTTTVKTTRSANTNIPTKESILTTKPIPTIKTFPTTKTTFATMPTKPISTLRTTPTAKQFPTTTVESTTVHAAATKEDTIVLTSTFPFTSTRKYTQDTSSSTDVADIRSSTDVSEAEPKLNDKDRSIFQKLLNVFGIMLILTAIIALVITMFRKCQQSSGTWSDKVRFSTTEEAVHLL